MVVKLCGLGPTAGCGVKDASKAVAQSRQQTRFKTELAKSGYYIHPSTEGSPAMESVVTEERTPLPHGSAQ